MKERNITLSQCIFFSTEPLRFLRPDTSKGISFALGNNSTAHLSAATLCTVLFNASEMGAVTNFSR